MKMKSRMKSKMDEKWMKKANCEQPYCRLDWSSSREEKDPRT